MLFAGVGMRDAVEEIAHRYQDETGIHVQLNLANSATLAQQLEAGADADVVVFASDQWAKFSERAKTVVADSRKVVANNDIVLVASKTSPLQPFVFDSATVFPALLSGKLAIGNPDAVPAGKYAMQSFAYYGWANSLKHQLLLTKDVRSALFYAELNEVDASVVFASDASKSGKVKRLATFPKESHKPIRFIAYSTMNGTDKGHRFYSYLIKDEYLKIWQKHGFLPVDY